MYVKIEASKGHCPKGATTMTIKDIFKKVENHNEVAEALKERTAKVYFGDVLVDGILTNGETFSAFAELRKHIRKEYFKDVADKLLNADDWTMDCKKTIETASGRELTFVLSLTQD